MANEEERFVRLEPSTIEASAALRDLFLADLERLEESIWRNEEIGEKPLQLFCDICHSGRWWSCGSLDIGSLYDRHVSCCSDKGNKCRAGHAPRFRAGQLSPHDAPR